MRVGALMILALLATGSARAEIYVCESEGKKTFSEQPCGHDAKVVAMNGERKIEMRIDMPAADISYLCNRSVSAWEQYANTQRSRSASNTYGDFNFANPQDDERRRNGVLALISNLSQIARSDPDLYTIARATVTRYAGPATAPLNTTMMNSRYYHYVTLTQAPPPASALHVDVAQERHSCESDLTKSLSDLHDRIRSDLMSGRYGKH
ncbi:MAG TPA: hypothetical protein VFM34_07290 [Moraxellaceae bacterium]|nr:hypothetical protein [Moraxellaceae bacterium]